jgi:hypothetical protein
MSGQGDRNSDGRTPTSEGKKKGKVKGASHGLHLDILMNPTIKAESGWEEEEAEYWTSKMGRRYVKMYHIDKLWPLEAHKGHTRDFCCKPGNCNNKHFVHRSAEVWHALFGDKSRSKGYINYSVACMVYAELILGRKVDWSTYPTTTASPLLLGANQKDIPDLYNSEGAIEKVLENTAEVKMDVVEEALNTEELRNVQSATKAITESSSKVVEVEEGEVFLTAPTHLTFTPNVPARKEMNPPSDPCIPMERGETSKSKEDEVLMGKVAKANATIDRLLDNDCFDSVAYKSPRLYEANESSPTFSLQEEVHTPRGQGVQVDNTSLILSSERRRHLEQEFPYVATLRSPECEILRDMLHPKELENLLKLSVQFAKYHEEIEGIDDPNLDIPPPPCERRNVGHIIETAMQLTQSAEFLAKASPFYLNLAKESCRLAPELLKGALAFQNLTKTFIPLFEGRDAMILQLQAYEREIARLKEVEATCKVREQNLKISEGDVEHLNQQLLRLTEELTKMRKVNAELKAISKISSDVAISPIIVLEDSEETQESEDKLSLPLEKVEATDNPDITNVEESHEMSRLEATPQPSMEKLSTVCMNAETQTEDHELEELKHQLEEAIEAKVSVESELNRLKLSLNLEKLMPSSGLESRWLAWVQKLQDKPSVVSRAMVGLQTLAMESIENCNAIESSLNRFKTIFDQHPSKGYTEITCWGDMDAMFERLNHTKKDEDTHINWALEAEEGWVPYNTLSAHIKDEDKKVVHACDLASPILKGSCSLCQGPFGPEGAVTMGQCRHTFHVTCIVKASLVRSVCAECRCPLSPRFYEMFGILEAMPPNHEYNRWTLPLDQGPFKFQNYLHWGRPLTWNSNERMHGLYEESQQPLDPDVWMTHNREVELRARGIVDDAARELFCRNMGGHWSLQHKKFFRFPQKKVERGPNDSWVEVNHGDEFDEQYAAYNHTLVGRALLLSKLEEAAKVRVVYNTDRPVSTPHSSVDVAAAFDKRIADIIGHWKAFLLDGNRLMAWQGKGDDEVVQAMVDRVESNLRALKADEVDLSPRRKQKRKREDDDDFSLEMKKQISKVDKELQTGGLIVHPSEMVTTRQKSAERLTTRSSTRHMGEGSGPSNGK